MYRNIFFVHPNGPNVGRCFALRTYFSFAQCTTNVELIQWGVLVCDSVCVRGDLWRRGDIFHVDIPDHERRQADNAIIRRHLFSQHTGWEEGMTRCA